LLKLSTSVRILSEQFNMSVCFGKVALVTGGAQGIGKAICEALLKERAKVCIADINEQIGEATLQELLAQYGKENVIFKQLDVANKTQFENVIKATKENFGNRLDILINNAGVSDETDWRKTIEVNLIGVMNGIDLATSYLSGSEKGGMVINNSSVLGIHPTFILPAYSASKTAVLALSLTWGHEHNVKLTKIKVNAICSETTDTQLTHSDSGSLHESLKNLYVEAAKHTLLKPSDVANGVIQIINDDVSGKALIVSAEDGVYYHQFPEDTYYESSVPMDLGKLGF